MHAGKKPIVLVVDDEQVIADTLAKILDLNRCNRLNGLCRHLAAVESTLALCPDLIISDVIMPDMNGIEAAISIRSFLPSCKILLFSGQAATARSAGRRSRPRPRQRFEILRHGLSVLNDLMAKLKSQFEIHGLFR